MDANRFDEMSRRLARKQTRRGVLKQGIGAAAIGGALMGRGVPGLAAAGGSGVPTGAAAYQQGPNRCAAGAVADFPTLPGSGIVGTTAVVSPNGAVTLTVSAVKNQQGQVLTNAGAQGEILGYCFVSNQNTPVCSVVIKAGTSEATFNFGGVTQGCFQNTTILNDNNIPLAISNLTVCQCAATTTTTTTPAPTTTTTTTTPAPTTTTTTTSTTTTTTAAPTTTTTTTSTTQPPTTTTTTTPDPGTTTTTAPPTTTTTTTPDPGTTTTTTTQHPTTTTTKHPTTTTTKRPPKTTTTTTTKRPPKTPTTTTTKAPVVTLPETGVGSGNPDETSAGPALALLGAAAVIGRSLVRRLRGEQS